ncbi:MAG: Rieske 2Fe-2S domain-containing protein [Gammaproteobacteria bacterium]|jgi:nitrite reductase/ring-hydroxylating ferredoxin subunit|nr:Rieske 2Fe-2S domain-containing protein [Gammaproteobacteria bacterium]MCP4879555.1 Rieske 2Fe-2S domain-containing protein [Gammaproteobacteria bacterium]MDP6166584.1 Rieske 2Fe-2S domain-containing protein [Gammaproteobacteria bacterium]
MPSYPQTICPSACLEDNHSLGFQHQQESGILVRFQGQVYAYLNRCPHRHKALSNGPNFLDDDGLFLQCEHHKAIFSIASGTCITGPCIHQQLTSIAVAEQEGDILLLGWPRQTNL